MLERMRQVEQEMLREFHAPVLHVDTTEGYDPGVDAILAFATAHHSAPPS